jgi:hypothetical protein
MTSITEMPASQNAESAFKEKKYSLKTLIMMLFSRVILFVLLQSLLFIGFLIAEIPSPWMESARYWPFVVTVTNLIGMFLLDSLLKKEGSGFWHFFSFTKGSIIKDILITNGLLILSAPIAYLPNLLLGNYLFGDYAEAINLIYQPLPLWAAWTALIVFPLTMPLGELSTYFGYVMPRLEIITKNKWLAITLPSLMLSFQHIAVPLLFDVRFMLWRLLMFLPFALIIGLITYWRHQLLPYLLLGHVIIDVMTALMLLSMSLPK